MSGQSIGAALERITARASSPNLYIDVGDSPGDEVTSVT
jgi:hypothetical protein